MFFFRSGGEISRNNIRMGARARVRAWRNQGERERNGRRCGDGGIYDSGGREIGMWKRKKIGRKTGEKMLEQYRTKSGVWLRKLSYTPSTIMQIVLYILIRTWLRCVCDNGAVVLNCPLATRIMAAPPCSTGKIRYCFPTSTLSHLVWGNRRRKENQKKNPY